MAELLAPQDMPRATIALWLGHWGTPPDVKRWRIAEISGQDHLYGTWLARPRGAENGWRPLEAPVPEGADSLTVAVAASKRALGLDPQSESNMGIITPAELPGMVTVPTIIHSFSTLTLPHPDPSIELGYFPINALPEEQLHPRFQRWLGPLMVITLEA
jgi:hypothetical protein